MSATCPTCGQPWPRKKKRTCCKCGGLILQRHKWEFLGERVAHKDCGNPQMVPSPAAKSADLLTEEAKVGD